MWVDRPGVGLPIFPNPCFGPNESGLCSVWAAMEGHGRGTDPIALLGWRVEYLAQFYIPIINQIEALLIFLDMVPHDIISIEFNIQEHILKYEFFFINTI